MIKGMSKTKTYNSENGILKESGYIDVSGSRWMKIL